MATLPHGLTASDRAIPGGIRPGRRAAARPFFCASGSLRPRRSAFSLVELLTVIFIISLLIGLLIPSINAARNAAKKASTGKTLDAIEVGLEMFKNENGSDFRLTNGYPPSFQHPPIRGYPGNPNLYKGIFPFPKGDQDTQPVVYGAHWLPAMLMGVDHLGYAKRGSVPRTSDRLQEKPWLWYEPDPNTGNLYVPDRQQFYLDPGNAKTIATERLSGRPPPSLSTFFPAWDDMKTLPVVVDAFDQPILYYAANTHGRITNMVEDIRREDNTYNNGPQQEGVPFYFHQDNVGFTGSGEEEDETGWDFGGRLRRTGDGDKVVLHAIAKSGAELTPDKLILDENRETFARYIVDRKIFQSINLDTPQTAPLRPVNADSYLLISAGPDGLYGTSDDVSNLPPWPNN